MRGVARVGAPRIGGHHGRLRRSGDSGAGLRAPLLVSGLILALCAGAAAPPAAVTAYFPLDAGTLAVGSGSEVVRVFAAADLVPGTRVLAGTPDTRRQAAEQRAWLAAGRVPRLPGLAQSTMTRDALLDLHVLSTPSGVAVAGWAPAWRYVWPRDAALVASALARTGHGVDAERVLSFLQQAQPGSGRFEARYRSDGTAVGDDRGPQNDSLGWALWALDQVAEQLPPDARRALVQRHRRLLERSARAALELVDDPTHLPPPSPDYWERSERRLTLSSAALVAAGLVAAGRLYDVVDQPEQAAAARAAADLSADAIHRRFADQGYPRSVGGGTNGVDLGVSFLLPPFSPAVDPDVEQVWRASATRMARPAGGLAPGATWPDDGVSWNTATSSYAMTAAFVGDRTEALRRLRWLDAHRTTLGSLPEKVLASGEPASVAPLAWPAAAVLIAADELERQSSRGAPEVARQTR